MRPVISIDVRQGGKAYQEDRHSIYAEDPNLAVLPQSSYDRAVEKSFAACHRLFGGSLYGSTLTYLAAARVGPMVSLRTAHVGDSPAYYFVLNRDGTLAASKSLINEHNPLPGTTEFQRIEQVAAEVRLPRRELVQSVDGIGRIYGQLAVSRSIGDTRFLDDDYPWADRVLLHKPETTATQVQLQPGQKLVVIAASDALVQAAYSYAERISAITRAAQYDPPSLEQLGNYVIKIIKETIAAVQPSLSDQERAALAKTEYDRLIQLNSQASTDKLGRALVDWKIQFIAQHATDYPTLLARLLTEQVAEGGVPKSDHDNSTVLTAVYEYQTDASPAEATPVTDVFAVYDGHGQEDGHLTSHYLSKYFPIINHIYLKLEQLRLSGAPYAKECCQKIENALQQLQFSAQSDEFMRKLNTFNELVNNPHLLQIYAQAKLESANLTRLVDETMEEELPFNKEELVYFSDTFVHEVRDINTNFSPFMMLEQLKALSAQVLRMIARIRERATFPEGEEAKESPPAGTARTTLADATKWQEIADRHHSVPTAQQEADQMLRELKSLIHNMSAEDPSKKFLLTRLGQLETKSSPQFSSQKNMWAMARVMQAAVYLTLENDSPAQQARMIDAMDKAAVRLQNLEKKLHETDRSPSTTQTDARTIAARKTQKQELGSAAPEELRVSAPITTTAELFLQLKQLMANLRQDYFAGHKTAKQCNDSFDQELRQMRQEALQLYREINPIRANLGQVGPVVEKVDDLMKAFKISPEPPQAQAAASAASTRRAPGFRG